MAVARGTAAAYMATLVESVTSAEDSSRVSFWDRTGRGRSEGVGTRGLGSPSSDPPGILAHSGSLERS